MGSLEKLLQAAAAVAREEIFRRQGERSAVVCMMTLNTCHPQIGLYFAWLGFYNQMLVFPALFGLFVFLFGAVTVNSSSINYAG